MIVTGVKTVRHRPFALAFNKDDIDSAAHALRKEFWELPLDFVNTLPGSDSDQEAWRRLARAALRTVKLRVER